MTAVLVDPETLHRQLDRYRIFDCRFSLADHALGRQQYLAGHIPGAQHLDMELDLSGAKSATSGRHPLPNAADFAARLRQAGVNDDTGIVVYDANRLAGAARAWWLLRYFGLSDVRVLDGGLPAWQAAGYAVRAGAEAPPAPGRFAPGPARTDWRVDRERVAQRLTDDRQVIVDAREAPRYAGLDEPIDPVAGRIPGALNFPWQRVTRDNGTVESVDNLRAMWRGVTADADPVVYCGSGVTACVLLLSRALAGLGRGRLYAGGWSEWCAHPLPVERD